MDEFVDELLHNTYVCDVALPYLPKRTQMQINSELPPFVSALEDEDLNDLSVGKEGYVIFSHLLDRSAL